MSASNGVRCVFNAEDHSYWLEPEHRRIPGVTTVLTVGGLSEDWSRIPEHVRAYAAQRGSYVHEATALYDEAVAAGLGVTLADGVIKHWLEGVDAEGKPFVDPVLRGYVRAWIMFRAQEPFVPEGIEEMVYTEEHGGLAGTIDRHGAWEHQPCIIDLKTGKNVGWNTAHQLAAYEWLKWPRLVRCTSTVRRQVVHLHDDGTYTLPPPYTDASDLDEFLAALTVTHAKLRRGVKLP